MTNNAPKTPSRPRLFTLADLLILPILLLALKVRLSAGPLIMDDSYISFRYAQNLADGHGLVYNIGERILGASCPLYLLMLSIPARLHMDLSQASFGIGTVCEAITVFLIAWLGMRMVHPIAGILAAVVYAVSGNAVLIGCSGMETPFYVALIMAMVFFLYRQQRNAAAVCAALIAVTRPEGILFGIALLGVLWATEKKIPIKPAIIVLAPLFAWCLFAFAYYGGILPLSVVTKSASMTHYPDRLHNAIAMLQYGAGAEAWFDHPYDFTPRLIAMVSLMALGTVFIWRHSTAGKLLVAGTLLFALPFAVTNQYMFFWYYTPLLPGAVLAKMSGVYALCHHVPFLKKLVGPGISRNENTIDGAGSPRKFSPAVAGRVLVGALLCTGCARIILYSTHVSIGNMRAEIRGREAIYAQAGMWAQKTYGGKIPIALGDIGAFGAAYQGPIVDVNGLVTPKLLPYFRKYGLSVESTNRFVMDNKPPVYFGWSPDTNKFALGFPEAYALKSRWHKADNPQVTFDVYERR